MSKVDQLIAELEIKKEVDILEVTNKTNILKFLLLNGIVIDNVIYYHCYNSVGINWNSNTTYMSAVEFVRLKRLLKDTDNEHHSLLPKGLKAEMDLSYVLSEKYNKKVMFLL